MLSDGYTLIWTYFQNESWNVCIQRDKSNHLIRNIIINCNNSKVIYVERFRFSACRHSPDIFINMRPLIARPNHILVHK